VIRELSYWERVWTLTAQVARMNQQCPGENSCPMVDWRAKYQLDLLRVMKKKAG
jgi:hypothetical protein